MNDDYQPKPYERLETDTVKSWEAFAMYRDMGVERSTFKVSKQLGKSWELIQKWSRDHNWVSRSADYDAYLDAQNRKIAEGEHLEALRQFRARLLKNALEDAEAANEARKVGLERLKNRYDDNPGTIASLLRAAAALSEAATNKEAMALGVDDLARRMED